MTEGSQCFDVRVQRSLDSIQFTDLYVLPGLCGGGTVFTYVDSTPALYRKNFYRLVSASYDRSEIVSPSRRFYGESEVYIYPNPVWENAEIVFGEETPGEYFLMIYSSGGMHVAELHQKNENVFQFERKGLAAGVYYLRIAGPKGSVLNGKMVLVDY